MELESLKFYWTNVTDLSPLCGMKLQHLICGGSAIADLSPVIGMPLKTLDCTDSAVTDLTPLKGMTLTELQFTPHRISRGMPLIRAMKSLVTIGTGGGAQWPADEFWKKFDAGEFEPPSPATTPDRKPITTYLDPAFKKWERKTAALPAEEQIRAVVKKLQELNPGFDGKVTGWEQFGRIPNNTPQIENGKVTEFGFLIDNVTDISPVRALPGLRKLWCKGTSDSRTGFSDLSPLMGLQLSCFDCSNSGVSDLSPLQGMPLAWIGCTHTKVADLSPLQGMPLQELWAGSSAISDLTPLKKMPLRLLAFDQAKVSDLSPLQGMALEGIFFTFADISNGMDAIRRMQSLAEIGTSGGKAWSAADFWKKYDAGEFK